MDCERYRELFKTFTTFPVPKGAWDTPEFDDWNIHVHQCRSCSDWSMQTDLISRNVLLDKFPCVHIAYYSTQTCDEHSNLRECTKSIVLRTPKFDEYFISPRGSTGDDIVITHCPWCGTKLPESKRYLWFERIEALGLESWSDEIPEEYQSDRWFREL